METKQEVQDLQRRSLDCMRCPEPQNLPTILLSKVHATSHVHVSNAIWGAYGSKHILTRSPHQTGFMLREKGSDIAECLLYVRHCAAVLVPSFSQQTCKNDAMGPDADEEAKTQKG